MEARIARLEERVNLLADRVAELEEYIRVRVDPVLEQLLQQLRNRRGLPTELGAFESLDVIEDTGEVCNTAGDVSESNNYGNNSSNGRHRSIRKRNVPEGEERR